MIGGEKKKTIENTHQEWTNSDVEQEKTQRARGQEGHGDKNKQTKAGEERQI